MKICPKCNSTYKDDVFMCAECMTTLVDAEINSGELSEKYFEKIEKKEKRINFINKLLIPLYYLIYIPIATVCVIKETDILIVMIIFALCPLLYYLSVFKHDSLFYFEHMLKINNIEDAQPSYWYVFTTKLGGYIALIFGIFMAVYLLFSLY